MVEWRSYVLGLLSGMAIPLCAAAAGFLLSMIDESVAREAEGEACEEDEDAWEDEEPEDAVTSQGRRRRLWAVFMLAAIGLVCGCIGAAVLGPLVGGVP